MASMCGARRPGAHARPERTNLEIMKRAQRYLNRARAAEHRREGSSPWKGEDGWARMSEATVEFPPPLAGEG